LRGELHAVSSHTDERGRFRIEGLMQRAYTLGVFLSAPMIYEEYGPIEAGRNDLELVLPAGDTPVRFAGRVISFGGEPISKLVVNPVRQRPTPGATPYDGFVEGQSQTTDKEGRFVFESLSSQVRHFSISGATVGLGKRIEIAPGTDVEQLEFVMPLRCRVQIELARPESADRFGFLDEDGEPLEMSVFHGDFAFSSDQTSFSEGRSEIVSVGEDARSLALYLAGVEVARVPLELSPEGINRLNP
jgi:hypothetical protein